MRIKVARGYNKAAVALANKNETKVNRYRGRDLEGTLSKAAVLGPAPKQPQS